VANPYVLTAVIVVMFVIAVGALVASRSRRRWLWLPIVAFVAVAATLSGASIDHALSFRFASLVEGVTASTSYLGDPPSWPPMLAFVLGIAGSMPSRVFRKNQNDEH
jgi:hydrogenase/urease accessory protein HupE